MFFHFYVHLPNVVSVVLEGVETIVADPGPILISDVYPHIRYFPDSEGVKKSPLPNKSHYYDN